MLVVGCCWFCYVSRRKERHVDGEELRLIIYRVQYNYIKVLYI